MCLACRDRSASTSTSSLGSLSNESGNNHSAKNKSSSSNDNGNGNDNGNDTCHRNANENGTPTQNEEQQQLQPKSCFFDKKSISKKSSSRNRRIRFAPHSSSIAKAPTPTPSASTSNPTGTPASRRILNEVIGTLKPASEMTDSERSDVYWQAKDYDYFQGTARIIASEVLKVTSAQIPNPHSYDSVLTRVYQVCAQNSSSSSFGEHTEADVLTDGKMILPPHLFAALTHWVKAGHSRRGLEKFCVSSHMQARPMAKATSVQAVLMAQDLLRTEARKTKSNNIKKSNRSSVRPTQAKMFHIGKARFPLDEQIPNDEILRLVSQQFSRTSRMYGTAIGCADAAAIGNLSKLPQQQQRTPSAST